MGALDEALRVPVNSRGALLLAGPWTGCIHLCMPNSWFATNAISLARAEWKHEALLFPPLWFSIQLSFRRKVSPRIKSGHPSIPP